MYRNYYWRYVINEQLRFRRKKVFKTLVMNLNFGSLKLMPIVIFWGKKKPVVGPNKNGHKLAELSHLCRVRLGQIAFFFGLMNLRSFEFCNFDPIILGQKKTPIGR